jgi:hypothetical protein
VTCDLYLNHIHTQLIQKNTLQVYIEKRLKITTNEQKHFKNCTWKLSWHSIKFSSGTLLKRTELQMCLFTDTSPASTFTVTSVLLTLDGSYTRGNVGCHGNGTRHSTVVCPMASKYGIEKTFLLNIAVEGVWFVFGRSRLRILARRSAVLTEVLVFFLSH